MTGDVVVVAGGALATPQLLLRSRVREAAGGSLSSEQIGRHVGFHPARLVKGLFEDVQVRGPFAELSHVHEFEPIPSKTLMKDTFTFRSPLGPLGALVEAVPER